MTIAAKGLLKQSGKKKKMVDSGSGEYSTGLDLTILFLAGSVLIYFIPQWLQECRSLLIVQSTSLRGSLVDGKRALLQSRYTTPFFLNLDAPIAVQP